jgi:hypothetical protein
MNRRWSWAIQSLFWSCCVVVLGACGAMPSMMPKSAGAMSEAAPAPPPPPPGAAGAAAGAEAARPDGEGKKSKKDETTWKRAKEQTNAARVKVGDSAELPISFIEAQVRVDGFRARVVLDYYFENALGRSLEGTFQIRLPNDASPHFFAFGELVEQVAEVAASGPPVLGPEEARAPVGSASEILAPRARSWKSPKEARMVPRDTASVAYGDVVRRRVDPALMEWSGAGVFSARLFPIQAGKKHRVVIGYDVDLVRVGTDLEYRLELPESVRDVLVDLAVKDAPGLTAAMAPATTPTQAGERHYARYDRPKEREFTVRLKGADASLITGTDARVGGLFAASFQPRLPAAAGAKTADQGVFLVDTSLSSKPDRFNIYLKLLETILAENRPSLRRFAVLFFNVEQGWWRQSWTDNTPENVQALLDGAQKLALEGATDLGAALSEASRPAWQPGKDPWDLFLLSDGASTWGENDALVLSRRLKDSQSGPIFAYQTGLAGTDTATLATLTRESGGAIFSVVGEAEVAKAAVAHRSRPFHIVSVSMPGAQDLLLAGRPRALFAGQTLQLVGRGSPRKPTEVTLTLERQGQQTTVKVPISTVVPSELAARAYGQVATGLLEELDLAEKVATSYASHFRVPGKTCSLLMMESEADYRRAGITAQDDGALVAGRLASEEIDAVLARIGAALGDPKRGFLGWLDGLARNPTTKVTLPPALLAALDQAPTTSFTIPDRRLLATIREQSAIPKEYLAQLQIGRLEYGTATDEAARRQAQGGPADALKALSSLVEQSPGDAVLARDVGFSAISLGLADSAYHLFRRVAVSRPFEPQTYTALARSATQLGKTDLSIAFYEVALGGQWPERFGEFRLIAGLEYLRLLRQVQRGELTTTLDAFARGRLPEISGQIQLDRADIVVSITWNTDNTDVDLHVIEPDGEECYYGHRSTRSGGTLTKDVTRGYGPEMYVLRSAPPGPYQIKARYFASDTNRLGARSKVHVTMIEGWGKPGERVTEKDVTLAIGKDTHDLATLQISGMQKAAP